MERLLHVNLTKEEGAKYALVPGSPDRCEKIAVHLDDYKKIMQNREFTTYEGYLEGERVLVVSTGIGGPGAAICMEELAQIGVDTFVRIGTCASTSEKVKKGDIVIPTGIVRMEGTSLHYLPLEFPAIPTYELVKELENASNKLGYKPVVGVNITKDSFFTQTSPETKPIGIDLVNKWNSYVKGGASSTSMESATLFIVAASLGLRVATVLVSATNSTTSKSNNEGYPHGIEFKVIEVGVEGLRNIIKKDKEGEK